MYTLFIKTWENVNFGIEKNIASHSKNKHGVFHNDSGLYNSFYSRVWNKQHNKPKASVVDFKRDCKGE